jgi:hypothetical protein
VRFKADDDFVAVDELRNGCGHGSVKGWPERGYRYVQESYVPSR